MGSWFAKANQTAVNFAYGGNGPLYDFICSDPVRERRFGTTIQQASQQPASSFEHIHVGFDRSTLENGTGINGGQHLGSCAVAIAHATPRLKLIVQDRAQVVAMAQKPKTSVVPADLHDRFHLQFTISFMNTRQPQTRSFITKCCATTRISMPPISFGRCHRR